MEIQLSPELQAKLDRACAENQSGPSEYVQQLVEQYMDHDTWFRQQVRLGLVQLDEGKFLSDEQMSARLEKMFRS